LPFTLPIHAARFTVLPDEGGVVAAIRILRHTAVITITLTRSIAFNPGLPDFSVSLWQDGLLLHWSSHVGQSQPRSIGLHHSSSTSSSSVFWFGPTAAEDLGSPDTFLFYFILLSLFISLH
jgi:hypothetical protein